MLAARRPVDVRSVPEAGARGPVPPVLPRGSDPGAPLPSLTRAQSTGMLGPFLTEIGSLIKRGVCREGGSLFRPL